MCRVRSLLALILVLLVVACGDGTVDTPSSTPAESTTTTGAPIVSGPTTTAVGDTSSTVASTTTAPTQPADPYTFDITIEAGAATGGGRIEVPLGETLTLRITSDVADEVHVHGYDLVVALEAGATTEIAFEATIPGVVEVETHDTALVLATIESS